MLTGSGYRDKGSVGLFMVSMLLSRIVCSAKLLVRALGHWRRLGTADRQRHGAWGSSGRSVLHLGLHANAALIQPLRPSCSSNHQSNALYRHDVSRRMITDFVNTYRIVHQLLRTASSTCPFHLLLFASFSASLEPALKNPDEIIEPLNDEIRVLVLRKMLVDVVD